MSDYGGSTCRRTEFKPTGSQPLSEPSLEEGCVEKTLTRPVCWNIRKQQRENVQGSVSEERKEIEEVLPEVRREDVFDAMIGADGSQKNVIERCKAAVSYPPDGLPILITGESGVGKSFLARLIHQYAISEPLSGECSVGSAELCRLCEQSRTIVGSTFRV